MKTFHPETVVRRTARGFTCYSYRWQERLPRSMRGDYYIAPRKGRGLLWAQPGETFEDAVIRLLAGIA